MNWFKIIKDPSQWLEEKIFNLKESIKNAKKADIDKSIIKDLESELKDKEKQLKELGE